MKTISLKEAHEILECAAAILVENQALYPSLQPLKNKPYNTFLHLEWENDEGLWYELDFQEQDNQTVAVSGSSLFLYDTEATGDTDHTQITILQEKSLE